MSDRENKMRAKTVVSRAEVQKESPATEKKSLTQKKRSLKGWRIIVYKIQQLKSSDNTFFLFFNSKICEIAITNNR